MNPTRKIFRAGSLPAFFMLFISFALNVPAFAAAEFEAAAKVNAADLAPASAPASESKAPVLSPEDEDMLDQISRKAFDFFVQEADRKTGLVKDRANNFKRGAGNSPASIASTGFALTAWGVGAERGWIDRGTATELARRTLRYFLDEAPQEHGFFYHFLNFRTGARVKNSELSPIDTMLLLAGVLFAAEYFQDAEIESLAQKIYERVDWPWMMHGGDTLALAWSPEDGFSKYRWDHYSESMLMYLMAIGSPTHPIPAESWKKILRPVGSYGGYHVIQMPPLFTHQYSHIWVDFRNKNDGYADYFQNSVNATLANRQFCIDNAKHFSTYGPDSWGLTASEGPFGYKAYGAPPGWAQHDGTVAPTACGSSIVFTPQESLACLRHFYNDLKDDLWGQYGFSDAFNLEKKWFSDQALAIDQGPLLLMIENYRTGLIWKTMAKNPYLNDALEKVGFKPGAKEVPWTEPPTADAAFIPEGIRVDGFLKDWPQSKAIVLDASSREGGSITDNKDLKAEVRFAWSQEALYFSIIVTDDSLVLRRHGQQIWQDDLVEIYVDPQGDGLRWKDDDDFQIGFRPDDEDDGVQVWSWFQGTNEPLDNEIAARAFTDQNGYVMEGGIRWTFLGLDPRGIDSVKLSIAVHDVDKDRSEGKVHWFFRNEDGLERFNLGTVKLRKPAA
ncbi:MAG TPA: glucoamylase family protein [Verrucomicrobiae bacterium]|nr:glucoamylase family protein [Verrucomicrobiae bacterium]